MGSDAFLSFQLLGIPVSLRGSPGDLLNLLRCRYQALPGAGRKQKGRVVARLQQSNVGWEIAVDDRPSRTASAAEEALRLLDELVLHAIAARLPDHTFVHASVMAVSGLGVVLPGLARSGKSVLALALFQAGARFLSDEIMVLEPAGEKLLPFPRAIRLPEACANHFPDLAHQFQSLGDSRFLPLAALGSEAISPAVPLAAVAVPLWEPARPDELRSMPRQAAAERLKEARLVSAEDAAQVGRVLEAGTTAARTFTLQWREPHSAAARLLEALS